MIRWPLRWRIIVPIAVVPRISSSSNRSAVEIREQRRTLRFSTTIPPAPLADY
ncbi:MAG: hypothetical protein ACE3L7_18635 [Candidatus Pristimantibacillus sp.]